MMALFSYGAPFTIASWFDTAANDLCTEHPGVQCQGSDIRDGGTTADAQTCCALCGSTAGCAAWTFNAKYDQHCWLKTACDSPGSDDNVISGYGGPAPSPPGKCALTSKGDCFGDDVSNQPAATPEACCDLCSSTAGCAAFTHAQYDPTGAQNPTCYLKSGCDTKQPCDTCTAGEVAQTSPPPSPPSPPPPPPGTMPSWAEAYAKANAMLARMTSDEKFSLMRGTGWHNYKLQKWWCVT